MTKGPALSKRSHWIVFIPYSFKHTERRAIRTQFKNAGIVSVLSERFASEAKAVQAAMRAKAKLGLGFDLDVNEAWDMYL